MSMKKRILTAVLVVTMLCGLLPGAGAATTGSYKQHAQEAAERLYCLSLMNGSGTQADGTPDFNLGASMTRGEAITMVVRLSGYEKEALAYRYQHPFTDVDSWGDAYVGFAYQYGISNGVSESTFGFQEPITQTQYLTLLLRALGYTDVDWQNPYPTANRIGLVEGEDYYRGSTFLRSDMCIISSGVLDVKVAGENYTLYSMLDDWGVLIWRDMPKPVTPITPGPTITAASNITVTSGEDMLTQLATQIDARNSTITVYTPAGQESAYVHMLFDQDGMARFTDVDKMEATAYTGRGYFVLGVTYRDHARVMAYMEGKTSTLSAEDMALYQEAVRVHNSLVDGNMSQYQRVKAFHDYLCNTVTYQDNGDVSHTAYGALVNHAAVCQGYTQAMDLLCFISGIDCRYISGTSRGENHSWVRVKVDGQWYNVDVTWDDQITYISYDYFLRSDTFMSQDHSWKLYPNWPTCPSDYPGR